MRIDLASVRPAAITAASPSLLGEWRVGAILQAVAVRDVRGQLWLDIGASRFAARIASGESGPADGERLQLRVLRNSPVLALESLPSTQADATDDVTSDALRRYVPRQSSPAPVLANLAWIARGDEGTETLPKQVQQAASRLWQALPTANTLTDADTLQQAVLRSGNFLEATLAGKGVEAAHSAVGTDLKALLLQLDRVLHASGARPAAALDSSTLHAPLPTPGAALNPLPAAPATLAIIEAPQQQLNELARQTEGALARLTTTQLANQASSGTQDNVANPTPHALMIELPVRHEDRTSVLRLRIEQDQAKRHGSSLDAWTVEAAIDLGMGGSLHARVAFASHRIGVQLRADSAEVVEVLRARSGELAAMLREAGLEVDRIVCLHGMPASDTGIRRQRLLDVRA